MARGVNKVILLGRVGQDPKINQSATAMVASLSMATSEAWKDKATGEKMERTEWHNVVFFGKLAEVVREYVHKGSQIYIEGKLCTTKYQGKETGQDKYSTKINADQIQLLDSKKESDAPAQDGAAAFSKDFDSQDIPF